VSIGGFNSSFNKCQIGSCRDGPLTCARKGNLPGGGLQYKSDGRESFVETCVYHGGGGKLLSRWASSCRFDGAAWGSARPLAGAHADGCAGEHICDKAPGFREGLREDQIPAAFSVISASSSLCCGST
jgi:hypothetical protein